MIRAWWSTTTPWCVTAELLLERFEPVTCVGTAADGRRGGGCRALTPDVVPWTLDARHGRHRGHPAHQGREAQPDTAVLVLTTFADDRHVMAAIDAGAVGCLLKDSGPDQLSPAWRPPPAASHRWTRRWPVP